jgi:hypothetical protein
VREELKALIEWPAGPLSSCNEVEAEETFVN